jgi:hypothetical protein
VVTREEEELVRLGTFPIPPVTNVFMALPKNLFRSY